MAIPNSPKTSSASKSKSLVVTVKNLWEKDKKIVIQQGIIIISASILIFFVLIPLSAKMFVLKNQNRELVRHIATAQTKIKRIPEYKQQLELYGKEIGLVEKRFFQLHDLDLLLGELSKLAANDGVVIMASKPLNDKATVLPDMYQKKYLPVSYEFTMSGDYHEFGKFINDIEQYEKLMLIRELTIQQNSAKQGRKLQSVFQVTAFVRAPEGLK